MAEQVPLDPQFEQRKTDVLTKADAANGPWSCLFDRAQDVFVINPEGAPEIQVEVEDPNSPGVWVDLTDGVVESDPFTLDEDVVTSLNFRVTNLGVRPLTLSVEPSIVDSTNLGVPSLTTPLGVPVVLAPAGQDIFTIEVTPDGVAGGDLSLSLANNDEDENPFNIELAWTSFVPAVVPEPEIRVYVNSPDLGVFTEVFDAGSQAVGDLEQSGPGEHYGALQLRIENDSGAGAVLNISGVTFPSVPGGNIASVVISSDGNATPDPFPATIAIGANETRFLDIVPSTPPDTPFTLDISIDSDDSDEDPFTVQLTGNLTAPVV